MKIKEKKKGKIKLKLLLSLIFCWWLIISVVVPLLIMGLHRSSYGLLQWC
jgi:hypothetical protein